MSSSSSVDDTDSDEDDGLTRISKFQRAGYETFEDDTKKKKGRKRTRDEATYGVFLDDDDESDDGFNGKGRNNKRGSRTKASASKSSSTTPMMFVKGSTQPAETDAKPKADNHNPKDDDDDKDESDDDINKKSSLPPPSQPDPDIAAARAKANDAFQALLAKAQAKGGGKRRSTTTNKQSSDKPSSNDSAVPPPQQQQEEAEDDSHLFTTPFVPMGLGFNKPSTRPKPRDPNLGKWEKHTKGIGMKLLGKMGYQGSGGLAGSQKRQKAGKNIARPVEVKVRPNQLGLGFGSFQEATKLKANRQLEAQVRGLDVPPENDADDGEHGNNNKNDHNNTSSSKLPSTRSLLGDETWRKGRRRKKKKVIRYTDILSEKTDATPVVIDMRGGDATNDDTTNENRLAPEILHNVTLVLQTHENSLHSASQFLTSSQRKVESLQTDIQSLDEQGRQCEIRTAKLAKVARLLDELEATCQQQQQQQQPKQTSSTGATSTRKDRIPILIADLKATFTPEERRELQFSKQMLPAFLGGFIRSEVAQWNPLNSDNGASGTLHSMVTTVRSIAKESEDDERGLVESFFIDHIVPRFKAALETARWDPRTDTERVLSSFEVVFESAKDVDQTLARRSRVVAEAGTISDDHVFANLGPPDENEPPAIKEILRKELILDTIYPDLMRALNEWEASGDGETGVRHRIDRWIIPWIPHLQDRSLLPSTLSDCRRKLRSEISFLNKSCRNDDQFVELSLATILPWKGILKPEGIQGLVSSHVIRKLEKTCKRTAITFPKQSTGRQDWSAADRAFDLHSNGFLSDREFLSLMEGTLLVRWADIVHSGLSQPASDGTVDNAVRFYWTWRQKIFNNSGDNDPFATSRKVLRTDPMVCKIFHSVVLMVKAYKEHDSSKLESIYPPEDYSLSSVLSRRSREERRRAADEMTRLEHGKGNAVESRIRLQRNGHTPTFREVVEEFAMENNLSFKPRLGDNSNVDGKQVFIFGNFAIYLDRDVVYVCESGNWGPIALDALAQKVSAGSRQ